MSRREKIGGPSNANLEAARKPGIACSKRSIRSCTKELCTEMGSLYHAFEEVPVKLDRRVAIITGAAAGIGEAAARLFAKEGARLVLVDLQEDALTRLVEELETGPTIVLDIVGDVSSESVCRSVVSRTMAQFGRLDILFNNAGIVLNGNLVECTEEEWQKTLDVNLKSMYLLCRSALPIMQNQGGGVIINMSSIAGPTGVVNRGAYSVSKAGVIGLTKSLAADFVKDGIRANCICPATVDTPSLRRRIAESPDPEGARRAFVERQPMGRLGTPEEIAAMALFLASDDSRYMTGQAVFMDGGMKL
jgi:NAD(P)-dependent dehydrogenase (short-subunit alcohol dehydrogenase family)